MDELNLELDDPDEYEGRLIKWWGAEYVIGRWFAEGGERIIHELKNRRSGLVSHLICILKDQEHAQEISERLTKNYDALRGYGLPTVIDDELVQAHGGWFELREAGSRDQDPHSSEMSLARSDYDAGTYEDAKLKSLEILQLNPDHTDALDLLSSIAFAEQETSRAIELGLQILTIEPNLRSYRAALMEKALGGGYLGLYLDLRAQWQEKWPGDHRLDPLAAEVFFYIGQPEQISELRFYDLEEGERKEIYERGRKEAQAKATARDKMDEAFALLEKPSCAARITELLDEAYNIYEPDQCVAINLGAALLRLGDWERSYEVFANTLPRARGLLRDVCLTHMMLALANNPNELERAVALLEILARQLIGPEGNIAYWDLPARVTWVSDDREWIEPPETISNVVQSLIAARMKDGVMSSELCALVKAYAYARESASELPSTDPSEL